MVYFHMSKRLRVQIFSLIVSPLKTTTCPMNGIATTRNPDMVKHRLRLIIANRLKD